MPDYLLVAGDGDDGRGGYRIHDLETGTLLRDMPRGSQMTDRFLNFAVHNDHVYARDTDSSLACFDADNTLIKRIDLGYYYNPGNVWVSSRGVHVIKENKDFGDEARVNANAMVLRTYEFETLNFVSDVVLTAPEFWDGASYLINTDGALPDPVSDLYWWIKGQNATYYKVDYDGIPTGVTIAAPSSPLTYYMTRLSAGEYVQYMDGGFKYLNFITNTYSNVVFSMSSFYSGSASYSTYGGYVSNYADSRPAKIGSRYHVPFYIEEGNDPAFPARNGNVWFVGVMSIDLDFTTNPVIEYIHPIYSPDGTKHTQGYRSVYTGYGNSMCLPDGKLIVCGEYFTWTFNSTGLLYTTTSKGNFQQGYSYDGEDMERIDIITLNNYTISGTITDTAGTTDRVILAYDDEFPDHLITEVITDSPYEITFFSPRPKRLICKSIDDSKNDKVLSHLIPA